MKTNCVACGGPIVQAGPGSRRKFCTACRPPRIRPERRKPQPDPSPPTVPVRRAVEQRLIEAGVIGSWRASTALALAENLDAGTSGGSALAALSRALREILKEIDEQARPPGRLAELRAARANWDADHAS